MTPIVLSWTNPTANTDGSAYAQANNAGYTVSVDGAAAVSIPALAWGTEFDMTSILTGMKLKAGNHTIAMAVVSTQGETSAYTPALTFPIYAVPNASGNLAIKSAL